MKLTEQQLAQIFQQSTDRANETVNVADCLHAPNVANAEAIVSDFNTAQAAKLAINMQPWSQQVATDISASHRTSWLHRSKQFISQCLPESPFAVSALAVVFTLSAVVFISNQPSPSPSVNTHMVTNDVINSLPFEGDSDRLSKGGFDGNDEQDRLFRANFS